MACLIWLLHRVIGFYAMMGRQAAGREQLFLVYRSKADRTSPSRCAFVLGDD